MFNIIEVLEKNGHKVIPFSVKSNYNIKSEYQDYFLSAIGTGNEIYAEEYSKRDLKTILKVLSRLIYSFEAKRTIEKLILKEKPDIAYILHYQNKISCSIIDVLYKLNIPIVHRISDFGHICANNIFYMYSTNEICELCLTGTKFNAVKNKCVKYSYFYSAIRALSLKFQEINKTHNKIDYFIFPALFTLNKYKQYGIPARKCIHIPTFFNFSENDVENIKYENFVLYVGRIDPDKGLMTLVKAFSNSDINLIIIGFSTNGYDDILKEYLKGKKHSITFLGKRRFDEIKDYLKRCLFTVLPSECNDNMPNTLLESFAYKKTVIASDIPSLKELIIDGQTGLFFQKANATDLKDKVEYLIKDKNSCIRMGEQGYELVKHNYTLQIHYKKLFEVFQEAVNAKKPN
jgi:glycosyltransferase involved in cell wall biosynthesis